MIDIEKVLNQAIKEDASDVHLIAGIKPILRIRRDLIEVEECEIISEEDMLEIYDYFVRGNVDKDRVYKEKSVIRPTFSYLGNYTISDKVIKEIVNNEGKNLDGITKLSRVNIDKYVDGIKIDIDVNVLFGKRIPDITSDLQKVVAKMVDYMTGINIFSINVFVKGIDMK